MEALLKITAPEAKQVIDQDKLKHKVSQESIWNHFGLTAHQYSQVPTGENATMVKKYYLENLNVYLGDGKSFFLFCSLVQKMPKTTHVFLLL